MKHKTRTFWAGVLVIISLVGCAPQRTTAPIKVPATVAPAKIATAAPAPTVTEAADLWTPTAIPMPPATAKPPTLTPAPVMSATSTPTPRPVAAATPGCAAASNANLRGGPGTNYPVVGATTAGQALEVVAKDPSGSWYQLAAGAWIAGELVRNAPVVGIAKIIPATPLPATVAPAPAAATATRPPAAPVAPAPPARSCCKVCGPTSKPCGDSCISLNKTCRVGPGCAC